MNFRNFFFVVALISTAASPLKANSSCDAFSDQAEVLPLEFLDRADPSAVRVAQPLEEHLLNAQFQNAEVAPLQKHYCRIGMFSLEIRFVQPVLDDAITAMVTQAIYAWDIQQEPAGWVLSQMRRHPMCARGPAPFAALCN